MVDHAGRHREMAFSDSRFTDDLDKFVRHTLVYFGGNVRRIWLTDDNTGEETHLYEKGE